MAFLAIVAFLAEQFLVNSDWYLKFALVAIIMLLAVVGPDAYIARRPDREHPDRNRAEGENRD